METNQATELCPKCGEPLVECENCETSGCVCCNEDWVTTMDDVLLCPECGEALQKEYDKATENGTKVCRTCAHFEAGPEWCPHIEESKDPREYCEDWMVNEETPLPTV